MYKTFGCFSCATDKSILYIWLQTGNHLWREVFGETEVLQAFEGSVQTAVVSDDTCLIEIQVWVLSQIVEG